MIDRHALLSAEKHLSEAEVRECMSGNICRCGAYPNIVAAVMEAQAKIKKPAPETQR